MHLYLNIEARSSNHCCSGKAISITDSECVFVALVIQHAKHMCHILVCVPVSNTVFFSHYVINSRFSGGKNVFNIKYVFMFSTTVVRNISLSKKE